MLQEALIEYLLRYKACPLPGLGTLELLDGNAQISPVEKKVSAPQPYLILHNHEHDTTDMVSYLSDSKGWSHELAYEKLESYAQQIKALNNGEEIHWPALGTFYAGENDRILFRATQVPKAMLPEAPYQPIIREDAVHDIRVGEKQTNSRDMSAYLEEASRPQKDFTWIWAAAIALVAVSVFVFYQYGNHTGHRFGNTGTIPKPSEPVRYEAIP